MAMSLIKTESFELAVNTKGDENSNKVAICLPGRLDTKDYVSFVSHLDYLSSKGFLAVAVDPPGTWESPGGTELFTTTNYIKAVNEVIKHYGERPTLLLGHSRGGAVAALTGSINPNVSGVVLVMAALGDPTPPDEKDMEIGFTVSYRDLPPGDRKTAEQKKFELPVNYFIDGRKHDPVTALKNMNKPKLLIYGTDDEFTPVEEAQEVYQSLPEPKMLRTLDCEHDYRYRADMIDEVNKTVGEFLEKYFK